MFYRWLKEVCDAYQANEGVAELKELITFFKEKVG